MFADVIEKWGGTEVTAMEVYSDIFRLGDGCIQQDGEAPGSFKANPIGYYRNEGEEKGHFRIMFENTFEEVLQELQEADFAIMNGLTYFGRRNVQSHASKVYALIFDLDGVTDKTLNAFFSGAIAAKAYPVPNYVALSGHGVHLYYVMEDPVELFPYIKLQMKELKYALTDRMWNAYTSTEDSVQHQGINQGFRVIGGKTKIEGVCVRAFRMNTHPFSIRQLCEFVPKEDKIDEKQLFRESKLTLAQAQKKYPEWYEKVIVQKDTSRRLWDISGKVNGDNPYALYDWWKAKILDGASYRHRYFAIMCLAIYGAKCDKPYDEVEADALSLVPFLNSLNPQEPFTEEDCKVALECYDARYCTFPIRDIEKLSAITIERNRRNGRKKEQHVKMLNAMRLMRRDMLGEDEYKNSGRPKGSGTGSQKVAKYRAENPDANVSEVARALGISRTTVYKWWDAKVEPDISDFIIEDPGMSEEEYAQLLRDLDESVLWDPEKRKAFYQGFSHNEVE